MFWFLLSFTETEKEIMQENPPPPKTPTGEEKGSPPPLPVNPLIPTTVPGKGMDIGIVIGVTESEFEIIKMFISRLLIFISQNFPNVQFGLIIYSDRPELIMTLQHIEYVNVKVIIEGMSYVPGGHRTDLAMLYASRKLFCPVGCEDRPEEENVMILFTSEKTDAGSIPYSLVSPIMKVYEKALFLVKVPHKTIMKLFLSFKIQTCPFLFPVLRVHSPDYWSVHPYSGIHTLKLLYNHLLVNF